MGGMATRDPDLLTHRALAEVSRVRILEELQRSRRPLDAAEVAERVGLHQNTVRSHLEILRQAGMVGAESERRGTPGRPRLVYRATAATQAEEPTGFRLLAYILAGYLSASAADPSAVATEAGRAWGRYLVERPAPFARMTRQEALERVVELLDRLEFAPKLVQDGETRIDLHHCPFRDLAVAHPEITCAVHLGLIRGALAEMGAPIEGERLDPFVTPSLCVAHFEEAKR